VNDIGNSGCSMTTSNNAINAFTTIADSAKARGIKVYGATITPFNGNGYYSTNSEACRSRINAWVRTTDKYDAVIDFDKIIRNPSDTSRILTTYNNDGLHPNIAGYAHMGNSIDTNLFIETGTGVAPGPSTGSGTGAGYALDGMLTTAGGGPPFRRIVDSGIPAGVGTDSTNVSALDPWLSLFYMTTGRNLAGTLTNDGQQITRVEALRLYTEGAAWFSFDDHHVGSFVEGKHADLAVLSEDYLTVPDHRIRAIESVLTLLGGRLVHAAAPFA
jgi:hypothetical protein